MSIERALKGIGVGWMKTVNNYDVAAVMKTLKEAMTTKYDGLKVIIAEGECQLERQRKIRPENSRKLASGEQIGRASCRERGTSKIGSTCSKRRSQRSSGQSTDKND